MHRKRSVYSPPDTHIWLNTVQLWPFVLLSTPRCNVSLQRQTEAHLSRLMQSQVQTALLWNDSTHTFLFLHKTIYLSLADPKFHMLCTSYFSTLFSSSYWKLEKLFSSGYWLHVVLPPIANSLWKMTLKSWFTNRSIKTNHSV